MADNMSDIGAQGHFRGPAVIAEQGAESAGVQNTARFSGTGGYAAGSRPVVVGEEATLRGWGRGPLPVDFRKYKYDKMRGESDRPIPFSVSKADRLDAEIAGDILHKIHCTYGIDKEAENRLVAFDRALWWEHTINGASMLQEEGGTIKVDSMEYDIGAVLSIIGRHQLRRFFRTYADDIAEVNRKILEEYDPYDLYAVEKKGYLEGVASDRGMFKYPIYAFDAADACTNISQDLRRALQASKNSVIPIVNEVDRRVPRLAGTLAGQLSKD